MYSNLPLHNMITTKVFIGNNPIKARLSNSADLNREKNNKSGKWEMRVN